MDKWRSKGKPTRLIREDSLLPPTRRVACQSSPAPLLDKRRHKKWSIDGLLRKFTSYLDAQSSSSSTEDLTNRPKRKAKGKSSKGHRRESGYAERAGEELEYVEFVCQRAVDLANANVSPSGTMTTTMSQLEVLDGRQSSSHHSRSSDGSLDGRRLRKNKVKARVEAKRDQLCVGDSSMDESSNEDFQRTGSGRNGHDASNGKRRSRASRTERYMKRMCNGTANGAGHKAAMPLAGQADTRSIEARGCRPDAFQPIDRVPPCEYGKDLTGVYTNGNTCPMHRYENDVLNDNYCSRQSDIIGVNPLVQQTLQYFSEFDRNMAAQQKARKTYPGHSQHNRRGNKSQPSGAGQQLQQQSAATQRVGQPTHSHSLSSVPQVPPKPPSRDHRSRVFENPDSLDKYFKYQQMMRSVPKPAAPSPPADDYYPAEKENRYGPRPALESPSSEVRNIIENRYAMSAASSAASSAAHNFDSARSPPRSPLRESHARNAREPNGLASSDYRNSNYAPCERPESDKSGSAKRTSKNLEEALNELEAIYNSLQLGDEELLERAEKRSMEEFHYRGITAASPDYVARDLASRRRTWAESVMGEPDRLKDDMAYRRMHPKERPSSVDGQSSLSSISYLMTSPIPSRRDMLGYVDPKRKARRKEPDVTLDDVVFRSMQYANNTLKVVEPQPPFGIPLGPITTAAESDYLHTNPPLSPRSRSPYIPSCEPDLVTDDLAYRNLRKDAQQQQSSRQASPSFLGPSPSSPPPLSLGLRKKRPVRSLSANLYGVIIKNPRTGSPAEPDSEELTSEVNSAYDEYFGELPVKCPPARRTSDPELRTGDWQRNNGQSREQRKDGSSDLEVSSRSYDESSDERLQPQRKSLMADGEGEYKTGSDRGSSYLSSSCSSLPPLPASSAPSSREAVQPITEQEISVYKKLCQDLENLVQLTKGIDGMSSAQEQPLKLADDGPGHQARDEPKSSPPEPSPRKSKPTLEEIIDEVEREIKSSESAQRRAAEAEEESPIGREISTILDNLRGFGEPEAAGRAGDSSCARREEGPRKEAVLDDRSFQDIAKDMCDLAARSAEPEEPELDDAREEGSEEPAEGRRDENPFFRNLELAKLSGEWRESTPKDSGAAGGRRRSSLTGSGGGNPAPGHRQHHWEGMNKCNHKYNSMPAKTSSLLPFRLYGSKRKSNNRKSLCTVS